MIPISFLQYCFVGTSSRSIDYGIPRRPVPSVRWSLDKKILERFSKLSRHAAVNGEVDRITQNDKKIREQNQRVCHFVIQKFVNSAGDDVQYTNDGQWQLYD